MMTFHGKDFNRMLQADLRNKAFKAIFNTRYIKDFPAVSRTKHKMIVDEGHSRSCASILIILE